MLYIQKKKVSINSHFIEYFFNHQRMWNIAKGYLHIYGDNHMVFALRSSNVVSDVTRYPNIQPAYILGVKPFENDVSF